VELPGQVVAWAVTRHKMLAAVLADPRFAKHPSNWAAWVQGRIPKNWPLISWVAVDNMLVADPPEHARLRRLVSQAFTARRVASLEEAVAAITARLLDQLECRIQDGPVDLKEEFALPLPMTVIADLFGVPAEEHDQIHDLCTLVFDQTITPETAGANHQALQDYLAQLIAFKRAHPADDLTSALISARDTGDRLNESELLWTLILMIGAGFETTMNLIANAVRALLVHPHQLSLLREGTFGWHRAVEETLRWQPPIAALPFRYATEAVDLGGVRIRAGDPVLMCYAAAGRDPDQHGSDADRFDITRPNMSHLAFSHGPHYCLGAPLARLETTLALRLLFERLPDLRLAAPNDELVPTPSIVGNGVTILPVTRQNTHPQQGR
jgi:2-hydroxy-5-methyl-1-naphthoate 7-hydroxylase